MADVAVLTRNYTVHLEPASKTSNSVTFYSNVPWKSIEDAHVCGKAIVIYFIVSEQPGIVSYEGTLTDIVIIPPVKDTARLNRLLDAAPDKAAKEEVETGSAKTVYSVSHIKKVLHPFAQTELLKKSDGNQVSKNYERSYCIVCPYE
ncbi:MAG: hypothetical protein FD134_1400 [Gallionellaceae bacterium]|nr:MAG: hypothetical protein FD134_1400 [Gallionellaceae bacterium]